jgi:hypothetical protein
MDRNYNPAVQKPMRIFLQGLHLANKEGALPSTTDQMKRKTASQKKKGVTSLASIQSATPRLPERGEDSIAVIYLIFIKAIRPRWSLSI